MKNLSFTVLTSLVVLSVSVLVYAAGPPPDDSRRSSERARSANAKQIILPEHAVKTWDVRPIPDTGQTQDATKIFGEDADYQINPRSYANIGDGTVTDNVTGLMWEQKDGGEMIWADAVKYCKNLKLAGHDNWRMPDSIEFHNLINHGRPPFSMPIYPNHSAQYWWTINSYATDPEGHKWEINGGGGTGAHPINETRSAGGRENFNIRCVRDAAPPITVDKHFTDNGDGTVTDNSNGLIWQQAEGGQHDWEGAITYCEGLEYGGKNDWRLPDIKELRSACDETLMYPTTEKGYFPNVLNDLYWSSSTEGRHMTIGWFLDYGLGNTGYSEKNKELNVRCVRAGLIAK